MFRSILMGFMAVLAATTGATAADINANQVIAQAGINEVNAIGRNWMGVKYNGWVNMPLTSVPSNLAFTTSQMVYGPPSGITPAQPTAIESQMAVNCPGTGQGPQVMTMLFRKTITKSATTTVTEGVSIGQSLSLSGSVPSWGVGASETTTVTVSASTSSSSSVAVSYAYGYTDQVTVAPGMKQSASLMVNFQKTGVPWSANVVYTGTDTVARAFSWGNLQVEVPERREPIQNFFENSGGITQQALSSLVPLAQLTIHAGGEFIGVSGSEGIAVNLPAQPLTPAEIAKYCTGGSLVARRRGRILEIPPIVLQPHR